MKLEIAILILAVVVIVVNIYHARKESKFRHAVARKIMHLEMWIAFTEIQLDGFTQDIERLHELIGSDGTDTEAKFVELMRQEIERLEKIHFPYRTRQS